MANATLGEQVAALEAERLDPFWERVDVRSESECWEWTGRLNAKGYGAATYYGRNSNASRIAWSLSAGVMPPSFLMVCHKCHNAPCCNPAHLYLGTATDNNRDAVVAGRHYKTKRTHCSRGHEFTKENAMLTIRKTGATHRRCRKCNNDSNRTRYRRKNPAALLSLRDGGE